MNHNMLAEVPNLEYIVSSHINQNNKNKWQIHKLEYVEGQNEFIIQFCGLGMDWESLSLKQNQVLEELSKTAEWILNQ